MESGELNQSLPSADAGLGSGRTDHLLTLSLGKTIRGFATVFNGNYFAIGRPGSGYDSKGEWTLAASHVLRGKWGFTGEVFGDSRLNAANDPYASSTWVLSYGLSPRLIFDGGSYVGLTSGLGAPGKSMFAGVTYALGNIYGRQSK